MRRLVVTQHVTLDGVVQGPGTPDEDPSEGFPHGGWHPQYVDQDFASAVGELIPRTDAYLFGRRTYEIMARYWPTVPSDDMFAATLNATPKYVASTTLREPLAWAGSHLLDGDVATAVRQLKQQPGGTISVLGSGQLVRHLLEHRLVDECFLTIDPLVLGQGRRLFDGVSPQSLHLVGCSATSRGVILATYRPS